MVLYIEHPAVYNKYTITPAILEFSKKINQIPKIISLNELYEPTNEYTILIIEGYQFRTGEAAAVCGRNIEDLKYLFPNSHIIVLGSYTNHFSDFIEYNHPKNVDLHLDTSYDVVKHYKNLNIISDMFIWSGTKSIYDLAKKFLKDNIHINNQRDCLCLCTCSPNYYDRSNLFNGLTNNKISVGFNLNKFGLYESFFEYIISSVTLGTTTPSSDVLRNGKGFRDWIGPFLNCPLIHDDYVGYVDIYKDIVPTYTYGDIQNCIEKINWVKSLNKEDKLELLKKQTQFAELNTIENQLYRAYKKYIIKTEPNIDIIKKVNID